MGSNSVRHKRNVLAAKQRGLCHWCGIRMRNYAYLENGKTPHDALTLDHVIPRGMGGSNDIENCVAACNRCNQHRNNIEQKKAAGHTVAVGNMLRNWPNLPPNHGAKADAPCVVQAMADHIESLMESRA